MFYKISYDLHAYPNSLQSPFFFQQWSRLPLSLIKKLLFQNEQLISAAKSATVFNSGFIQAKAEKNPWPA